MRLLDDKRRHASTSDTALQAELAKLAVSLRDAFGVAFSIWHRETGELLYASLQQPGSNDPIRGDLVRAIVGSEPQFLADEDALAVLAVPLRTPSGVLVAATAAFALRQVDPREHLHGASEVLGLAPERTASWINRQTIWPATALVRLAASVQAQAAAQLEVHRLQDEVEKLSTSLATTYEEICLLHGVTQNLRISSDEHRLCELVIDWLLDCMPATAAAIQLQAVAEAGQITYKARTAAELIGSTHCPLDSQRFSELVEHLQLSAAAGPVVINHNVTDSPNWPFPEVRQLIIVPMSEGDRALGWLAVFNHVEGFEFGTVEASLLSSVGAMLGIHSSNRDLYREQSEFLASVVRALTSAIDAKDPYTCGHSDRVARISVRLAKELGCDPDTLHTLYMSGLLHDIGKIGIDDAVLRKPGMLTDEEFEHIKQHPELGYRILADIKQLSDVLPAVLHHHEQWDGRGYPFKLASEQIPLIARIVAVADAFDAMSSDRPYRKGMPEEKVHEVFRRGAGKQWDPSVIEAFFTAREDIRAICSSERANLSLDVEQWT